MEIAALPTTATGRITWAQLTLADIAEVHAEAKTAGRSDITRRARTAARRRAAAIWARRQASAKKNNTLSNLSVKAGLRGPGALDRFAARAILAAAEAGEQLDTRRVVHVVEQALHSTDGAAEARGARVEARQARRDAKHRAEARQRNADIAEASRRAATVTPRQVDYIVDLLLDRADEGGMTSTSHLMHSRNHVNRSAVEALTQGEAHHLIDSLKSNY